MRRLSSVVRLGNFKAYFFLFPFFHMGLEKMVSNLFRNCQETDLKIGIVKRKRTKDKNNNNLNINIFKFKIKNKFG